MSYEQYKQEHQKLVEAHESGLTTDYEFAMRVFELSAKFYQTLSN